MDMKESIQKKSDFFKERYEKEKEELEKSSKFINADPIMQSEFLIGLRLRASLRID